MGVCRGTSKKGGLRHGHNPKRGVLGTGKTKKRGGGLRHGHESKKGGLRYGLAPGGDEIARVDDFDMPEHHSHGP